LIIELTYVDLVLGIGLILIAIGLSVITQLRLEKDLIVGAIRTFVQLIAVGYVLNLVFSIEQWYVILPVLLVMMGVAIHTIIGRQRYKFINIVPIITFSLTIGTGITLFIVIVVIINVEPWYTPQYIIPIMGMILGNSMNGVALAAERLSSEIRDKRALIETRLSLGATSREAVSDIVASAVRAAMIPTVNSLMTVGIVSLPGMMTGQILAGTSPIVAVKYQIIVMYMIAAGVMISSVLIVYRGYKQFFTDYHQFRE
jgi:putative ABC transport system permease protein